MNSYLTTFLDLQQSLTQLKSAERRLQGVPEWMKELHDEHTVQKAEIDGLEEAAAEASRDRRTAESAVSDAQEKLKKYQQQLNRVSNQREYGALLQEIDTAKSEISGYEEQAITSLGLFEQAQKDLVEKRDGFGELAERYRVELARWEEEKPAVARQVEELRQRIAGLREKLPRPLLSQFERILDRNPAGALAPVRLIERPGRGPQEWHCSACNYRVRPQVVVEIRNGSSLVQCDSCKRILYIEAAVQSA
jgi:predicted  nucleic acid-binding Zn-ribbon protein